MKQRHLVLIMSLLIALVGGVGYLFGSGRLVLTSGGSSANGTAPDSGDPSDPDSAAFWDFSDQPANPTSTPNEDPAAASLPSDNTAPAPSTETAGPAREATQPALESTGTLTDAPKAGAAKIRIRIAADGATVAEIPTAAGISKEQITSARGRDNAASDRAVGAIIALLKEHVGAAVEVHLDPMAILDHGMPLLWLPKLAPIDPEVALFVGGKAQIWAGGTRGVVTEGFFDETFSGTKIYFFRKGTARPYTVVRINRPDGTKTRITTIDQDFTETVETGIADSELESGDTVRLTFTPPHGYQVPATQLADVVAAVRKQGVDVIDVDFALPQYMGAHLRKAEADRARRREAARDASTPDPALSEDPGVYLQFQRDGTIEARIQTTSKATKRKIVGTSEGVATHLREEMIVERLSRLLKKSGKLPINLHAPEGMLASKVLSITSVAMLLEGTWTFNVYAGRQRAFTFSAGKADHGHFIDWSDLHKLKNTKTHRVVAVDRLSGWVMLSTTQESVGMVSRGTSPRGILERDMESAVRRRADISGAVRILVGSHATMMDVAAAARVLPKTGARITGYGIVILNAVQYAR